MRELHHLPRYWKPIEEFPWTRLQAGSKLQDVLQARTALSAFDLPEVRPVHPTLHRGGLLAPAQLPAATANPIAELMGGLTEGRLG